MSTSTSRHLTYTHPDEGCSIDACISHIVSIVSDAYQGDPEKNLRIEYYNNTLPNKLFECIKKSPLYQEERLMKSIDYNKANDLLHLIEMIELPRVEPQILVIENLQLLVNATKLEYPLLNERVMHLLMFLKIQKYEAYILDPSNNVFTGNNCIDDVVV